eukprot:s3048_g4.t2
MSAVDVRDHLRSLPPRGCSFSVRLGDLYARLCLANAAQWQLPELEVGQDSFCHRGFDGKASEFLRSARREVWEARERYPESSHAAFDAFLESLDAALLGEKDLTLIVRDPSGLSKLDTCETKVEYFERTVRDDFALGLEYPLPTRQRNDAKSVAKIIRRARHIVALTGAGISVESGITPFRKPSPSDSAGAIWDEFDAQQMTVGNFNHDGDVRAKWWVMKRKLMNEMSMAEPNPAHCFFGELEKRGKLAGVITQNIDSLHQRGGVPGEKVNELHGHMRRLICSDYRTTLNPEPFGTGTCDYACDTSACGHADEARTTIQNSDLLVVIGSTLIVRPANELPAEALRRGIPVIMVNFDDTCYDSNAISLVRQPAGIFFDEVMNQLGAELWHGDEDEDEAEELEINPEASVSAELKLPTLGLDVDSDDQLYGDDDLGCELSRASLESDDLPVQK